MKTALLWNTYAGDVSWFKFSARSFSKFARGWDYAKCIVPNPHLDLFRQTCETHGIDLVGYDEWPDKGFNHHQAMTCYGDHHFPDADVIFHIDADCVFAAPCSPSDWFNGGKLFLPFNDFSTFLKTPLDPDEAANFMGCTGLRSDFNRGQYFWKFASDFALGWSVERETMTWMPIAHYRGVYAKTRSIIEKHHRMPFEKYVQSCRNEFPQSFCEFNALGGVAHRCFQDRYSWRDIHAHGYPFWGKVVQCWSHGGLDRPHEFGLDKDGLQTPRELFGKLGLI